MFLICPNQATSKAKVNELEQYDKDYSSTDVIEPLIHPIQDLCLATLKRCDCYYTAELDIWTDIKLRIESLFNKYWRYPYILVDRCEVCDLHSTVRSDSFTARVRVILQGAELGKNELTKVAEPSSTYTFYDK